MPRRKPLTVGMLRKTPKGTFLYCRNCGSAYSATRGDYFMLSDDHEMQCAGPNSAHPPAPLVLMRKETRLVMVSLED